MATQLERLPSGCHCGGVAHHHSRRMHYHVSPCRRHRPAPAKTRLMDPTSKERLWGWRHALDASFVRGFVIGLLILLVAVPLCIWLLQVAGKINPERRAELCDRYRYWLTFIPLMIGQVLHWD